MRRKLARWIVERLLEQTPDGRPKPPGSSSALTLKEPNGAVLTAVTNGDTFDVYQGRGQIYAFAVSSGAMRKLARFVLWWWIVRMWCGLKPALWRWAQRRSLSHGD